MQNGPKEFKEFFYRIAHKHYFGPKSLRNTMKISKFKSSEIKALQIYGLSNTLNWFHLKKAMGHESMIDDDNCNNAWFRFLELNLFADKIYCIATK